MRSQSDHAVAAGGDLGADGRGGASVFVHGDGSDHCWNCSIKARNTWRAMNSGWRLLSMKSSGTRK
jgi:hypothetical protein